VADGVGLAWLYWRTAAVISPRRWREAADSAGFGVRLTVVQPETAFGSTREGEGFAVEAGWAAGGSAEVGTGASAGVLDSLGDGLGPPTGKRTTLSARGSRWRM